METGIVSGSLPSEYVIGYLEHKLQMSRKYSSCPMLATSLWSPSAMSTLLELALKNRLDLSFTMKL
jgi:hypothetical protein